jgi:Fe-S oxidoreductase
MQCGLCSGSCPLGDVMVYPPRKLILQAASDDLNPVLSNPSLWMCIGCYMCSHRCPRQIELTDGLWPALRGRAIEDGFPAPTELQQTLQNVFRYGNTLGKSPRQRLDWAKNLEVRVLDLSREPRPVEVLWLVGCYPSYYPRNRGVTRDFARILTILGISWGVLGNKEKSVGECDWLYTEEGLFETLAENTRDLLASVEFDRLVTLDPHSYLPLVKAYSCFGVSYPVEHYTSFLANRLEQLKPLFIKRVEATVTYHDNCCVGRRYGFYNPPRALLEAIPGVKLVEMSCNRENALCCGGGSSGMWLDAHIAAHGGHRLSDQRVRMAADTGADILAVSCPYELSRFEDAAKVRGLDGRLKVRDIVELLAEAMDLGEENSL